MNRNQQKKRKKKTIVHGAILAGLESSAQQANGNGMQWHKQVAWGLSRPAARDTVQPSEI